MKSRILASVVILLGALLVVNFVPNSKDTCVNLYVDYNVLDNNKKINTCIDISSETTALDVLKKANLKIEGTRKYGLGVICRVNGLPDESVESCEVMPPANAYWAIIIKEKQLLPFPTKEWGWGQLAVDKQPLNAGDSIGIVWADNGEVVFP